MAQEEHNQRCGNSNSNNGGGGGGGGGGFGGSSGGGGTGSNRSSKKLKQKKVPQRGLGVAQLEKIRIDELQKRGAANFSPNSLVSPTNSSCFAVGQCAPTNFRQDSPFPVPLPPPPSTDLSTPNSVFRPPSSIPNVDPLHLNSVPLPNQPNGGGGGIGYPAIPGLGHGNWPRLWNGDYSLERESHRLDQNGFAVRSNINSPYECNPLWPPPGLIQKAHQFQQQPSSSSMMDVSLGTSSSSVMEPPSNQSFYSNYYTPKRAEEGKMVGTKRPYPSSRDNQSGPSFPRKFPPTYIPPIATRDVSSSSSVTRGTDNAEPSNPFFSFREAPSSSTFMPELNPNKVAKENGGIEDMDGDFLTLAPPTTALPHPRSKHKLSSLTSTPTSRESSELGSLSYQGSGEDQIHEPGPSGSTIPNWPFYSFFPSAKQQVGQETAASSSCSEKVREKLDLNLKL